MKRALITGIMSKILIDRDEPEITPSIINNKRNLKT